MRWRAVTSELFIALCIAMAVSSYWGNALDAALAGTAFFCSLILQANLMHVFLRSYLGPALQESLLDEEQDAILPPI